MTLLGNCLFLFPSPCAASDTRAATAPQGSRWQHLRPASSLRRLPPRGTQCAGANFRNSKLSDVRRRRGPSEGLRLRDRGAGKRARYRCSYFLSLSLFSVFLRFAHTLFFFVRRHFPGVHDLTGRRRGGRANAHSNPSRPIETSSAAQSGASTRKTAGKQAANTVNRRPFNT